MIKPYLFFPLLLLTFNAFSQYSIEPKVKAEYDSLFNIQPGKVRQISYIQGFEDGFALLLKMEEDTLNMHDFLPIKNDI